MNCREFRRKHDAFIDDTLSGMELDGMAHHCRLCQQCSRLDTRVRRALLIARNLTRIEPSPAFGVRLHARLKAERRMSLELMRRAEDDGFSAPQGVLPTSTYAAIAAAMIAVAGLAGLATLTVTRDDLSYAAPVVATRLEPKPSDIAAPAMVAAIPEDMPIWPAAFVAEQAPWHFANDATGGR
jgi:hypothetical protein